MAPIILLALIGVTLLVSVACKCVVVVQRVRVDGWMRSIFGSSFLWGWRYASGALVAADGEIMAGTQGEALIKNVMKVWIGANVAFFLVIAAMYVAL